MKVSDELIEAMCVAQEACYFGRYDELTDELKQRRMASMRHALAVLPEPASAATTPITFTLNGHTISNGLLKHGCWAVWKTDKPESGTGGSLQECVDSVVKQDGPASQELPTRDEVAEALRQSWHPLGQRGPLGAAHTRENWRRVADKAIELLARRPAADETEALRKLEQAGGFYSKQAARIADLESQLASVTGELDTARKFGRVAEEERDEALAKLAARPAPVVIDEALAERVLAVYYKGDSTRYGRYLGADMLATLRAVFGDRASVSVPQGERDEATERILNAEAAEDAAKRERDQLRAEIEKTRAELEACKQEFSDLMVEWQTAVDVAVEAGADIQGKDDAIASLNAVLEACCRDLGLAQRDATRLSEQLDALRSACAPTPAERAAMSFWPNQHSKECAQLEALQSYACRVERALLKPAPAQYHPNDLDDVDGDVSQLDEPGRQAPAEAEPVKPKGDEHAKRQVRRTVEEEGPADAGEAAQREGGHGPCRGKERRLPTTDGGGILGAGVTRWEDQPSATNDVGELQEELRARLFQRPPPESAMVEPVRCDFGDECPGHASPDDRPCGWEPASPADALRPNDRHAQKPVQHPPPKVAKRRLVDPNLRDLLDPPPESATAAEQVLRHASEPDCEPIADWVARRVLPGVPASLQPLTERVERLERGLRSIATSYTDELDPRGWIDLWQGFLDVLDARKGGDQ